ncbi:MAG: YraN family protein [Pyrinomonadaceae bacterium]
MSDILSIIEENKAASTPATIALGERGEGLAAEYLIDNGYRLVVSNFKVPVGRNRRGAQVTGEIDIVALDGETLCFIEVKTRR